MLRFINRISVDVSTKGVDYISELVEGIFEFRHILVVLGDQVDSSGAMNEHYQACGKFHHVVSRFLFVKAMGRFLEINY